VSQIVVTLRRSLASEPAKIKKVVAALGLKRISQQKVHKDNNCIRGMVNKVKHLVSYELKG